MVTRSLKTSCLSFLLLCLVSTLTSVARDIPDYQGFVSDYATILSDSEKASLETKLRGFDASTSTQIAVLTINSLEGEAIEDFSIRLAEKWRVGQKGLDNGAILVIAKDDRRLRIEVGYGLEGVIPDIIAGRIIDNLIVPEFKAGNFSGGIDRGVEAIMSAAQKEYGAIPSKPPTAGARGSGRSVGNLIYLLIMAVFFPIFFFGGLSRRRRRLFWGGPFGGFYMGGGSFGGHSSRGGGSFGGFGGGGFGGGGASGSW